MGSCASGQNTWANVLYGVFLENKFLFTPWMLSAGWSLLVRHHCNRNLKSPDWKTPIMICLCQNVSRKLKGCTLVESTPPPGMWGIITKGSFCVLSYFTLCIGYMLCSVRCSSVLSSHSCAQKYLLTTHSPNPFISLYLLLQTILLLQISATLGPLGLYPAALLESDWADHPPAVSFTFSDGVLWGQTWQSEFL